MYNVDYQIIAESSSKPDVSIVVPVYNGQEYIRRCLEYLVWQTKQEIEVVIIDNFSDDNTLNICLEFHKEFPDKVSIYQLKEHKNSHVYGRNLGIDLAKGEYLMFCDADDIMHFRATELAYQYAIERNFDLVCFPHYIVEGHRIRVHGRIKNFSVKNLMMEGEIAFWCKCVRKKCLLDYGYVPENVVNDDWAYWFGVYEHLNHIGYLNVPLYYYIKRSSSEAHDIYSRRKLDIIKAHNIALSSVDKNKEIMEYMTAKHLHVNINRDWVQLDKFLHHLKELWPTLKNNSYLKNDERLNRFLELYAEKTTYPVENTIFLNGFSHIYSQDEIDEIKKIYFEPCEIVILNENNCDINELNCIKTAYNAGNIKFVGEYFALKNIFEKGGVYIDFNIVIDTAFNYIKCFKAFIGYLNLEEISPYVFGGHRGNNYFKTILETYKTDFYEDKFYPLYKRMKNILIGKYGYKLTGNTDLFSLEDISVLGMDILTLNIPPKNEFNVQPHLCHYKYFDKDDKYVIVNKNAWNFLSPVFLNEYTKREEDRQNLRKDRDIKRRERDIARRDLEQVKKERNSAVTRYRQLESIKMENDRILRECRRLSAENDRLSTENQRLFLLKSKYNDTMPDNGNLDDKKIIQTLQEKIKQMEDSKSWRWTKWLRKIRWKYRTKGIS